MASKYILLHTLPSPLTDQSQLEGYNAQKASFSRTIHIKQVGHALLTFPKLDESYLITIPALHIEGLIYGKPFVELNNCTYISSSTGFVSKIDYSGKGWLSGKKNSFTASMYPAGKEKEILYSVEGQWTDGFVIKEGGGKKLSHSTEVDSFSHSSSPKTGLIVPPLESQDLYETKKAWGPVARAISKGDMDTTANEKSKIENAQRELRKKEQAEGREWERRFFTRLPGADKVFETLAKPIGEKIEAEKTGGVWRFDEAKARDASPPYHAHQSNGPAAPCATIIGAKGESAG